MDQLNQVPCLQVNSTNIDQCWSHIVTSIKQSHFIALDLELSGLGDKKNLILKDIDDRYKAICEVAKTRSILSVGLSFFRYNLKCNQPTTKIPDESDLNEWNFKVNNFELLTRCRDDSVLEEESKAFLQSHGFDFDLQESSGLPYLKGNQDNDSDNPSVRKVFRLLVAKKVPLVFHNGLIDLIFIYHHFLASLPSKLTSFVADLDTLFSKGIFDTKYIAEHGLSPNGSYLEYLFYSRQRQNLERKVTNKSYITIGFNTNDLVSPFVIFRSMETKILGNKPPNLKICDNYRQHGWCQFGSDCNRSHDIDYILDDETTYKTPNKTRSRTLAKMCRDNQQKPEPDITENIKPVETAEHINGQVKSGIHRSGYDAFMTGYCLATVIIQLSRPKPGKSGRLNFTTRDLQRVINKIFLTYRKEPLIIHFSEYSKTTLGVSKLMSSINTHEETQNQARISPEKKELRSAYNGKLQAKDDGDTGAIIHDETSKLDPN